MPSKARGYYPGFRFPPNRIKKMMQKDEEVGKVAQPVPVMLSRALELFTTQLLRSAGDVAELRGAKTLTPSHLATAIQTDPRMDFLQTLVEKVPMAEAASSKTPLDSITKKPARGAKTLTPSEVAAAIQADPRMEFVETLLGKVETTTTKTSPHAAFKTSPHGAIKTSPKEASKTSPRKQPATDFSIQTILSPSNNLYNLYEIPANKIPANKTPDNKTPKTGGKTLGSQVLEDRPSPAIQLSAKSPKAGGDYRLGLEAPAPPSPPAFQVSFPAGLDEDYDAF